MKSLKKPLCIILAVMTIAVCFAMPASAASKKKATAAINVSVSSVRESYGTVELAFVKVTAENKSDKTVNNIVLTAASNQLCVMGNGKKLVKSLAAGKKTSAVFTVLIAKSQLSDANMVLRKTAFYQHQILKPKMFKAVNVSSGKKATAKLSLEFGAWNASITGIAYYDLSDTDYKGAALKASSAAIDSDESVDEENSVEKLMNRYDAAFKKLENDPNNTAYQKAVKEITDEMNAYMQYATEEELKYINEYYKYCNNTYANAYKYVSGQGWDDLFLGVYEAACNETVDVINEAVVETFTGLF